MISNIGHNKSNWLRGSLSGCFGSDGFFRLGYYNRIYRSDIRSIPTCISTHSRHWADGKISSYFVNEWGFCRTFY